VHQSVYDFVTRVLGREQVEGKHVLEVGALDVNGSVRPYVTSLKPASYVGTDRRKGRRVDRVIAAEKLSTIPWGGTIDLVICTETLEHIQNWRVALWSMVFVLRQGGMLVLTTRSEGFPRHEHPDDHWRFDRRDFDSALIPWEVVACERDPEAPGMFLAARKTQTIPMDIFDRIRATRAPVFAPHQRR
jgi:SAM-dependent methyltransferase